MSANKLVRHFWEVCLKRIQELWLGYECAKEKSHKTVMALCSRAALETMALPMYEVIFFEKCVSEKRLKDFFEFHKQLYLGYVEPDSGHEIKAKNILTAINAIDKYFKSVGYFPNAQSPSLSGFYADLSNFCHPNWHGVAYCHSATQKNSNEDTINLEDEVVSLFDILLPLLSKMDAEIKDPRNFQESE